MSDKMAFQELYRFLSEASEDTLKLIGVSPSDDGFTPGPSSNAGDDNKQPDLDPHALQASRSETSFDDKGKRPVREPSMPRVSTPATPMLTETMRRKLCEELYTNLLRLRADTKATVLSAGDLRMLFTRLGMSPEVTEDGIRRILTKTRYADKSGLMDIEYFSIFAKDFELLETMHAHRFSQLKVGEFKFMLHDLFKELADIYRGPAKDQQECDNIFKQLLKQRGDPTATVLPACHLCGMLKKLGMPTKVNEDELGAILTFLGYAGRNGTFDSERFMNFNLEFKLLESLHAYNASLIAHEGGHEYVERGPLREFFQKVDYVVLEPPRFPGSSSGEGSNRMQSLLEKRPAVRPISASASPSYRARMHQRACKRCFDRLLSLHGDPNATALRAGSLCGILKELGMTQEVTDDQLRDMLKYSGHADEDGTLDFERFTIFAKDFLLVESLRTRNASLQDDQGPLGDFFEFLLSCIDVGEEFSDFNFSDAFDCLGIELEGGTADTLARYANYFPGTEITFEQFLRVLRTYHEERMQRAGETVTSRRPVVLDRRHRLGRLVAFVSTYTRGEGGEREGLNPVVRNNDTEVEGDVTNIPAVTPVFRVPK